MGERLIYDLETDGLLPEPWNPADNDKGDGKVVTTIHCMVVKNADTGEVSRYFNGLPVDAVGADEARLQDLRTGSLHDGFERLKRADIRIGHNIVDYDDRVLRHLGFDLPLDYSKDRDTITGARVCWPDEHLKMLDAIQASRLKRTPDKPQFPRQLIGKHKLEAWGFRLGLSKKTEFEYKDFSRFTVATLEQCVRDVEITAVLFDRIEQRRKRGLLTNKAWILEQQFSAHLRQQMDNGVAFDVAAAEKLVQVLTTRRAEVDDLLQAEFKPWTVVRFTTVRKERREKTVAFNPESRHHIAKVLMDRGWKPAAYGVDGIPTVDEAVLSVVKGIPGIDLLRERLMLGKRLGQLAEGKTAWLKMVKPDGRIHGRINHNAAVTNRSTHASPNMSAVPRLIDNYGRPTPYGRECRALFTATPGGKHVLVGGDAKGLELRMLAHFLHEYDNGMYADVVVNGDPHATNAKAAGLSSREQAKRFIYAYLYGAGDRKIAGVLGCSLKEAKLIRARFQKNLGQVAELKRALLALVGKYGAIPTLDGRWLHVRSAHAALNTLLQGSGAIVLKATSVIYPRLLKEKGLIHGVHYKQVLFSHDEVQIDVEEQYAPLVQEALSLAVKEAGEKLGVKCPLAFDTHVGKTWAETH